MKKKNVRFLRLLCAVLTLAMLVSTISVGASASESDGLTISTSDGASDPSNVYIYKKTNTTGSAREVKLVQYPIHTGYSDYSGSFNIPSTVAETTLGFPTYYTVAEIGGREGEFPGALEGVNLSSVSIPSTVTYLGSYSFANSTIDKLSLSTSVAGAAETAFAETITSSVSLDVTTETTLLDGADAYRVAGRARDVKLPAAVQAAAVNAPLTITGNVTMPGEVKVNSKLSLSAGSTLNVEGKLSGSVFGNIELASQATLNINSSDVTFSGYIRLANGTSTVVNNSSLSIRCFNASGGIFTLYPGETATGAASGTPVDSNPSDGDKADPDSFPQITANYGGTVYVADDGVTVTVIPAEGYHIEEVVINGFSMGKISRYIFEKATSENTISVTFAEGEETQGPEQITPVFFFTDVSEDDWFADSVKFVVENGILYGVSSTEFAPNDYATRAMFITALSRFENYDPKYHLSTGEPVYLSDVPNNTWYTKPANWAVTNGILRPSGTAFRPDSIMNRQEMAMYLYNYTKALGYNEYVDTSILGFYDDANTVYPQAREAVAWAVSMGYLEGRTHTTLNLYSGATRAEVADMLMNYLLRN